MDEDLKRVKGLHEEVAAGVRELILPNVDFARLQDLLDAISQENTAMVTTQTLFLFIIIIMFYFFFKLEFLCNACFYIIFVFYFACRLI